MGRPSKQLQEFMSKFKIDHDEIWEVRSGGAWAIKHSALERVAGEQSITFDIPQFAEKDGSNKIVAMLIVGHMGDKTEWSVGEASPSNNKNSYPYAMAEKRGKDRVILKLLNRPGDVYSEEEADDFKRQNPHTTKPEDVYDNISDDIPTVDVKKMRVVDSRPAYTALVQEMQRIQDPQELYEWGRSKAGEIHALSGNWPTHFKGEYTKHKESLEGRAA
jgi:hypothetical protein